MSTEQTGQATPQHVPKARPWIIGLALFAGVMMIVSGIFQALQGITAIVRQSFYVVAPHNVYEFNTAGWGWVHLVIGVVLAVSGFFVIKGHLWARVIGIILATISAIANFMFIPHYPFWSILIIALDVLAIWALCGYSREVAEHNPILR